MKKLNNSASYIDRSYYLSLYHYDILSQEEEIKLFDAYRNGSKEAFETLIKHSLRLVVYIAKKFQLKFPDANIMDLIAEGNISLLTAIKKYDYTRGGRFITFAYHVIKNDLISFVKKEKNLQQELLERKTSLKLKKIESKLYFELGRVPTILELTDRYNQSYDEKLTPIYVENLKRFDEYVFTMEDLILDNDMIDTMESQEGSIDYASSSDYLPEKSFEDKFVNENLNDIITGVIVTKLTPIEREVLALRYGFNEEPKTLTEIAKIIDYSIEGVRKIELRALKKLRNNNFLRKILLLDEVKREYPINKKYRK